MAIMKNVTMNINPNAITSISPPAYYPSGSPVPPEPAPARTISVSFSAQFDTEDKAMDFASIMLNAIKHYGD